MGSNKVLVARRELLRAAFVGSGLYVVGGSLLACSGSDGTGSGGQGAGGNGGAGGMGGAGGAGGQGGTAIPTTSNIDNLGPLGPPDENGVRLPEGFTARIVARSGQQPTARSSYVWHNAPDGGAVYPTSDGGWIYVSNAEVSGGGGGVGALRFAADGTIVDAYSILTGTTRNCAGGKTPWGTWLSCEETSLGLVYECDPTGMLAAEVRPALGAYSHEAAAVDPVLNRVYLTEDRGNGRLYRYTPDALTMDGHVDLTAGQLEVLQVDDGFEGSVSWLPLPDPSGMTLPTREQVPESSAFNGGEGIWYHEGVVYFTTKGDNQVWALETATDNLTAIYVASTAADPSLTGVDNVTVSGAGDVLVAEDGGDLEIKAITPAGNLVTLVQLVGHDGSELAGPAFTDDHQRLYFSSQRGSAGNSASGITFEVSGPFFI
jgi:uncharacterized protein